MDIVERVAMSMRVASAFRAKLDAVGSSEDINWKYHFEQFGGFRNFLKETGLKESAVRLWISLGEVPELARKKIREAVARRIREKVMKGSLNVVAPNSSKDYLSIPENFDVVKEFKQPGIKVYSGGNDWETPPICFVLMKNPDHRGERSRLWVELNPPPGCDDFGYLTDEEKARDLDTKTKEKLIRERGEEFLKMWEEAARKVYESNGANGLPSSLDYWAQALRETEELHPYVKMSGSDRTEWKKTNLLVDEKSV